jgi:hypothetical protein
LSGSGNLADSFRRPDYIIAIKTGETMILFPRNAGAPLPGITGMHLESYPVKAMPQGT